MCDVSDRRCRESQVLTERGTLAGLHNGDGHVVWSRAYGLGAAPTHLLPWRSSHNVQHAPEARPPAQVVRLVSLAIQQRVAAVWLQQGWHSASLSGHFRLNHC